MAEVVASLERRVGDSRLHTGYRLAVEHSREPAPAVVSRTLLDGFAGLDPSEQSMLVDLRWDLVRDPSLVPVLLRMAREAGNDGQGRTVAISRLHDLAPHEARPFILAEILDPGVVADFEALAALADETLPDADEPLVRQIRALLATDPQDVSRLELKSRLLARFATARVYPVVVELYASTRSKVDSETRAAWLAYLLRWNEKESLPRLQAELRAVPSGADYFLYCLTRSRYTAGIDEILRTRLNGDNPDGAAQAALLLARFGGPAAYGVIKTRLDRWRQEWGPRVADLDSGTTVTPQASLEIALIAALLNGAGWTLRADEVQSLHASCLSAQCRTYFQRTGRER